MNWLVRQKKPLWQVLWQHHTLNSSWWGNEVIRADSAKEAAMELPTRIEIEKHVLYNGKPMLCRVYRILEEYEEFEVSEIFVAENVES